MPTKKREPGKTSRRFGKDPGGRPPRPSSESQESIHLARKLGYSALGKAVLRQLEALDAVKPIFLTESDGKGHTASVPGEDVPDHAIRLRAAEALEDRFGIPKTTIIENKDEFAEMMMEAAQRLKAAK